MSTTKILNCNDIRELLPEVKFLSCCCACKTGGYECDNPCEKTGKLKEGWSYSVCCSVKERLTYKRC